MRNTSVKPRKNVKNPRDLGLLIKRLLVFVLPLIVVFGAVGATMAMSALKPEPEEKEETVRAVPVLTSRAVQEDVTLSVRAQGEVQPRQQIYIVPQVGGKITYMSPSFIEGGQIRKGETLIRIDPAEYALRVTQARANVAQAETVLAREKSEAEIAKQDWEELNTGQAASPLTLRMPQMTEAAAQLEAARARLGEAELQLSRTTIRAPFSGRVADRMVDAGEYVTTGTRLGQVYASAIMDVRLPLTNADLAQAGLSLGFNASKKTPAIPVTLSANVAGRFETWQGRIVRTDSGFDPKTRVLFAYAEVDNSAIDTMPLAPGLFVDAEIEGQSLGDMMTIPRAGLRGNDEVYLAQDDGTLKIQVVDVVSTDKSRAVIRSGIQSGDLVITSPIRGVGDGMKIDVVERSAAAKLEE